MDYIYNFSTNQLATFATPSEGQEDGFTIEEKWILLMIFIVAATILGLAKLAINKGKKPKEKPPKKKKEKKPKKKKQKKKDTKKKDSSDRDKSIEDIVEQIDEVISKNGKKK
jgi:hypothetical protein